MHPQTKSLFIPIKARTVSTLAEPRQADLDAHTARIIAIETVEAHCARNNADVLAIAQIIACGMASLDNVIFSMADDIARSLRLRLQSAANALNRTVEQNRRFLKQDPPAPSNEWYGPEDAATLAGLGEAQRHVDEQPTSEGAAPRATEPTEPASTAIQAAAMPMPPVPKPPTMPAQPAMPQPAAPKPVTPPSATPATAAPTAGITLAARPVPDMTEHEKAVLRASSMNRVAGEYTASIPHLPPAKRREATMRANALGTTASALISRALPEQPKAPERRA